MTLFLGVLVLMSWALAPVAAQVGVTTDIVIGVVTDSSGAPVANAAVDIVSLETGVSRSATTAANGRYRILFPDGGGRYQLFARAIGMTPVRRVVQREGDDDRIVADIQLVSRVTQLREVTVRARGMPRGIERPTPGSNETMQNPERLARLPIDAGDLNEIAALAPGVVAVGGTDSTAAGFSVAGQRPSANATTLDGLTFGASTIPQDAVRVTRVVTSTYDVGRGQFSGGLVASTSRSGTSTFQASLTGGLRDPSLAITADSSTTQPQTRQQLSFGVGGPLVRNRLFGFAAGQVRHRGDRLISSLTLRDGGVERLGLAADSLERYFTVLGTLGVPLSTAGDPDARTGTDWSGLARVDLLLGNAHTLTLRGDGRHSSQEPTRTGPLALVSSGGTTTRWGAGGMLQLSSQLGQSLLNEAKAYFSIARDEGEALLTLPRGRVQLASVLADGTSSTSSLVFGGSANFPSTGRTTSFEATNELSWLPGDATHRIKLGVLYTTRHTTQEISDNLLGTFTFQSLEALEAGRPALFTRTLASSERTGRSSTGAIYLGDMWRPSGAFQLIYGLRAERSWFGNAPAYNALVDTLFGLRTDRLPEETHLSPRAGFTWTARPQDGPPTWLVRGGVGEFRSPIPERLAVYAQSATDVSEGETQLVCAGPAAPIPDWGAYAADPTTIPVACADGTGDPGFDAPVPTITAFADRFTAPRVWRGSLGVQRQLGLFRLGLDMGVGFGVSQFGFEDRNLGAPQFVLSNEANRPVYVDPGVIDPASGTAPLLASRRDPRFGQVLAVVSDLTTRSMQAVLSANGIVGNGMALSASYTWSRATDESSDDVGRAVREPGRSFSDFDRRHQVVMTATMPVARGLEVTGIGRLVSGVPFTPQVAGDLNADGARNDRAFIDASVTEPLGDAPARVRECLVRQSGTIAARNSCRGPWQPSLDVQLNWRPDILGLQQRLMVSVVTSNLMAGVDQLLHSDDDLRGWGQFTRPDPTLLTVESFDPVTQQYTYAINERFGRIGGTQSGLAQPFQIGLQVRVALGSGPRFGGFGGGRRGFGGPGRSGGPLGGPGSSTDTAWVASMFAEQLARMVPDPLQPILDRNISLRLTDLQMARLDSIRSGFIAKRDSLGQAIRAESEQVRGSDPAAAFRALRERLETGQAVSQAALEQARGVLSAEQWAQLPEELKTVRRPARGRPD